MLRRARYATAVIGKWSLHGQPNTSTDGARPDAPAPLLNRGFESFYDMLRHIDGHEHYPKAAPHFAAKATARGPVSVWDDRSNVTAGLDKCYTTDFSTARAKNFITTHTASSSRQPFFLFLAFETPHAVPELPTQAYPAGGGLKGGLQWLGAPGRMINTASGMIDAWIHPDCAAATYVDRNDSAAPPKPWPNVYRRPATNVRRIDDAVADLRQLLVDLRLAENTLIVFTSDNGSERESMLGGPFTPVLRELRLLSRHQTRPMGGRTARADHRVLARAHSRRTCRGAAERPMGLAAHLRRRCRFACTRSHRRSIPVAGADRAGTGERARSAVILNTTSVAKRPATQPSSRAAATARAIKCRPSVSAI